MRRKIILALNYSNIPELQDVFYQTRKLAFVNLFMTHVKYAYNLKNTMLLRIKSSRTYRRSKENREHRRKKTKLHLNPDREMSEHSSPPEQHSNF